ncbi:MAG: PDZ domain-containing protein, partial [Clostridia bacterium]|nr:PDZ domain-containing protein [Clostridia bacterium]
YGYVRGVVDDGLSTLDITEANLRYYYYNFKIDKVGVYVVSSEYCDALANKDRIVSINGVKVYTTSDINDVISQYKVGDTLTVVASRDGEEFTASLTLQEYVPDSVKDNLK